MAACLCAPPLRAGDLKDALTDTYIDNPRLQADRARQLATDEQLPQARSGWLPNVAGRADYGYRSASTKARERRALALPPGWQNEANRPYGYGVTVTQPLFRGFRTVNETRKARANVAAGRAQLADTEQTVLLDTVFAYMAVIRDRAVVRHRRKEVDIVGRILKSSSARHRNGVDTRTDVSQARARRDSARALYDRTLAKLADSEAEFENMVGRKPGKLNRPPEVTDLLPQSRDDAVRMAERNNPKIKSAVQAAKAAKYNRKAATGAFLPTVDLEVDYSRYDNVSRVTDRTEDVSVLVKVNVPIFTKGLNSSKVRQAKAEEAQRRYEESDARYGVAAATIAAYEEWRSAQRRVGMLQDQVKAAVAAARGVRLEQEVGDRSVLDVLNAEREVVNARVALENAQFERIANGYSLLATVGLLRAEMLNLPTTIYDPKRNAKRVRNKFIGTSVPDLGAPRKPRRLTRQDGWNDDVDPVATGSVKATAKFTSAKPAKKYIRGAVFLQDVSLPGVKPDGRRQQRRSKTARKRSTAVPRNRPLRPDPVTTSSIKPKKTAKPRTARQASRDLAGLIKLRGGDHFFR